MELIGKIISIGEIEQIKDRLQKREVIIQTGDKFPQTLQCFLINQKCSLADNFDAVDSVSALIDLKGRQHQGKYFINIEIWGLNRK